MELSNQPPNSPDFNVLELGFFNSIQDLKLKQYPKQMDDLVADTDVAFADIDSSKLNNVFLSYNLVMKIAMKVGGENNYKLQNICKAKLQREGSIPNTINHSDEALDIANYNFIGDTEGVVGDVTDGLDIIMESMDVFNMFLSDADATFAAVNELEPLHLNE